MSGRHDGYRGSAQAGLTLVEMVVAVLASVIVALAISRMAVSNQRLIVGNHDQALLQQEMSRMIEIVSRDVHVAHAVASNGDAEFRTFAADGSVLHVFRRGAADGQPSLLRDGVALTDRQCASLNASTTADSTALLLNLSLSDDIGNESDGFTQVCVRNRALEF